MAQQQPQQAIHKFVLGNKELEGKTAEFQYDKGWYSITDIVGEERSVIYKSRNAQEAYMKWNVYIGRKKERRAWDSNPRCVYSTQTAFRVFYSQHTLADFEKKCPILRVNALVRKKWLPSPFWLLPTVRNARELSERTNRTAIKHNNRKSP